MKIKEAIKRLQALAERYPDAEVMHYSRSSLVPIQDYAPKDSAKGAIITAVEK